MSVFRKGWAMSQKPGKAVMNEVKYSKSGWKPILITIAVVLAVGFALLMLALAVSVGAIYVGVKFLKALIAIAPKVNKDALPLYFPRIKTRL